MEEPFSLSVRQYVDRKQIGSETVLMADLQTALIRLKTTQELYSVEGYLEKGIGNAFKVDLLPINNHADRSPINISQPIPSTDKTTP